MTVEQITLKSSDLEQQIVICILCVCGCIWQHVGCQFPHQGMEPVPSGVQAPTLCHGTAREPYLTTFGSQESADPPGSPGSGSRGPLGVQAGQTLFLVHGVFRQHSPGPPVLWPEASLALWALPRAAHSPALASIRVNEPERACTEETSLVTRSQK